MKRVPPSIYSLRGIGKPSRGSRQLGTLEEESVLGGRPNKASAGAVTAALDSAEGRAYQLGGFLQGEADNVHEEDGFALIGGEFFEHLLHAVVVAVHEGPVRAIAEGLIEAFAEFGGGVAVEAALVVDSGAGGR